MDNSFIALGLMSGTSLDGIDASIIKSDGENNLDIIDNKYLNYPEEFRKRLSSFILNINNKADIEENISTYKSLERDLTHILTHFNIKDYNLSNIKKCRTSKLKYKIEDIYSQENIKLVEQIFKEEIHLGNYQSPLRSSPILLMSDKESPLESYTEDSTKNNEQLGDNLNEKIKSPVDQKSK